MSLWYDMTLWWLYWGHRPILRMVGASDWKSNVIAMYLNDSGGGSTAYQIASTSEDVKHAIAQHLAVLAKHLFMSAKPPKPTQSRWTGVAGVCRWALRISLFHRCLSPMLSALATKESTGEDSASGIGLDNDARSWGAWWQRVFLFNVLSWIPVVSMFQQASLLQTKGSDSDWCRWSIHGPSVFEVQVSDSVAYRAQQRTRRQRLAEWCGAQK